MLPINAVQGHASRRRPIVRRISGVRPRRMPDRFSLLHYLNMQPDLHREGYAVFVRCCDLSSETPAGEFASVIDILDGIIGKEDFFPSPSGAAIYRHQIDEALAAAHVLASGLGKCGISV